MRKNLPQYSDIALIAITVVHTGMSMDWIPYYARYSLLEHSRKQVTGRLYFYTD
jgi:hypothetical protein